VALEHSLQAAPATQLLFRGASTVSLSHKCKSGSNISGKRRYGHPWARNLHATSRSARQAVASLDAGQYFVEAGRRPFEAIARNERTWPRAAAYRHDEQFP
jgi:hypothetical protein